MYTVMYNVYRKKCIPGNVIGIHRPTKRRNENVWVETKT